MKIAITAATGQLGSAILKATAELVSKENVVALARTPEKASHLGVEVRPGDYDDPEALEVSLKDIDSLLVVSGNISPEKRIPQHRNVINAAKSAGVKRIVYTSVQGAEENTAFSPVIQSNRQTEKDVQESGLDWVIGRNGIYIEPDIEYIENYKEAGKIINSAGDGKCGYTSRPELGYAYARMLTEDKHLGQTYNLHGESLTQFQLAKYLTQASGTDISYQPLSVEEYKADRTAELGDFLGTIIAGIYQGIREGASDNASDFAKAAGREHQSWDSFFSELKL